MGLIKGRMARLYRPLGILEPQSNVYGLNISSSSWTGMVSCSKFGSELHPAPKEGPTLTTSTNARIVYVLTPELQPWPSI